MGVDYLKNYYAILSTSDRAVSFRAFTDHEAGMWAASMLVKPGMTILVYCGCDSDSATGKLIDTLRS